MAIDETQRKTQQRLVSQLIDTVLQQHGSQATNTANNKPAE